MAHGGRALGQLARDAADVAAHRGHDHALAALAVHEASLDRPWDHRVDIFAAGIILYELLTKQKPFQRAVDVDANWAKPYFKLGLGKLQKADMPGALQMMEKVIAVEPMKRLAYSWNSSGEEAANGLKTVVTWMLTPSPKTSPSFCTMSPR